MTEPAPPLHIFVIAGEPSGDNLGGRIMAALRRAADRAGQSVRFTGVGGARMAEQGLDSLFPMQELSLFGMLEVLPHAWNIFRRMRQVACAARTSRPDAVLTIDSPAFSFGVADRLRGSGIPLVHLNAPKVWAYRPGRVHRVKRSYDHLLALLPFEPPYFEAVGLPCTFIGHPAVEAIPDAPDGAGFRARHGIATEAPVLCLLPGSRGSEIKTLLPVFAAAVTRLQARVPGLRCVLPTVPAVAERVRAAVAGWDTPPVVIDDPDARWDAFAASDTALAASGTVAVELALAGVPMVVTYRLSAITTFIVRRMVLVRFVTIVNLVLDREVVPELLQELCRPDPVADAVTALLTDDAARARQREGFAEALRLLGQGGPPPSEKAAAVIHALVASRRASR
jgi:lipid-A-disaccharide synthase